MTIVDTAAKIGDVIVEKSIEIRIRIIDSRILRKTESTIARVWAVSPRIKRIASSTDVERSVTRIVVSVSPRHFPMSISTLRTGFGRRR